MRPGTRTVKEIYNIFGKSSLEDFPSLRTKISGYCVQKVGSIVYCLGGGTNDGSKISVHSNEVYCVDLSSPKKKWKKGAAHAQK